MIRFSFLNEQRSKHDAVGAGLKPALCMHYPETGRFEGCPYTCRNACLGNGDYQRSLF